MILLASALSVLLLGVENAEGRVLPLGEPFEVSVSAGSNLRNPQITALEDGGFVIVWRREENDDLSAHGRRFVSVGDAVGGEFEIEGVRVPLSVAASRDSLLVAFDSAEGVAVASLGLDGSLQQIQVADPSYTLGSASVAATQQGEAVLAWNTLPGPPIRARRFQGDGDPVRPAFIVDSNLEYPLGPRVAPWADGSFVVVWGVERSAGDLVLGRMFGPDDEPLRDRFVVSPVGNNSVGRDVCVDEGDTAEFIVAWNGGGLNFKTMFRRFNAAAEPRDSTLCLGLAGAPSLSCLSGGRFVAAAFISTTDSPRVFAAARAFNRENESIGTGLVEVAASGLGAVSPPKIAALNDGTVVVTWSECIAEGECSIFAQRFTVTPEADCPGDCNRDGQVTVDELVVGVELALHGEEELRSGLDQNCLSIDTDSDCAVSVNELVSALNHALEGCD